jgi:hypothetical protein
VSLLHQAANSGISWCSSPIGVDVKDRDSLILDGAERLLRAQLNASLTPAAAVTFATTPTSAPVTATVRVCRVQCRVHEVAHVGDKRSDLPKLCGCAGAGATKRCWQDALLDELIVLISAVVIVICYAWEESLTYR